MTANVESRGLGLVAMDTTKDSKATKQTDTKTAAGKEVKVQDEKQKVHDSLLTLDKVFPTLSSLCLD